MSNIGMRIFPYINRPPKALIQAFAGIPVANIADNMNRMSCMDARIRPINEVPLLGPAFTVKSRPGDNLMLHKALDLAQPGDIVVVDAQGDLSNSIMGELMALWAKQRDIGGFIIDGAIRDIGALRKMGLPIYAAGVTPAGPYKDGPGELNVPVACGGVVVHPGDILVGDEDGIVVINPRDAEFLLEKSKAKSDQEKKVMEDIANKAWDRRWVDQALLERGVVVVKENRISSRTNVQAWVTVICNETEHFDALAVNISADGILLQTQHELEVDRVIEMILPKELGNVNVVARIIWKHGNHIGCNFVDMPMEARTAVDQAVYWQLSQNLKQASGDFN